MPRYDFKCGHCGTELEVVRPMCDSDKPWKCTCGKQMKRVFGNFRIGGCTEYHRPLVSDSLAVNPCQIEEHKKMFPDIPMTGEGQPVFTNYKQHNDYLEKTGFIKERQKIRSKGKKIR